MDKRKFYLLKLSSIINASLMILFFVVWIFKGGNKTPLVAFAFISWFFISVANSVNNFLLLQQYSEDNVFKRGKRVFFWIMYTLFIFITIGLIILSISFILNDFFYPRTTFSQKNGWGFYLVMGLFTFPSIYICIYQPIFFSIVNKNHLQANIRTIESIGENNNSQ